MEALDITKFLVESGCRRNVKLPPSVYTQPTRWRATADFDANAETSVLVFPTVATYMVDDGAKAELSLDSNQPEVGICMEAIRVDVLDEAAFEHLDPEDLINFFNGFWLEWDDKSRVRKIPLADAFGFPLDLKPAGGNGATGEDSIGKYGRPSRWMSLPYPIYENLKSARTLAIKASAAALNSLLSADTALDVYVKGALWDANMYDVPAPKGGNDCGKTGEAIAVAGAAQVPRRPTFPTL